MKILSFSLLGGAALAFAAVALANPSQDGAHGFGAKLDANGDGKIHIAEVEAEAAKRAAEIDANRDGRIVFAEVEAYRTAQRKLRAEQRLLRLDADGNGSVSTEEFAGGHSERMTKLDRDGDGVLSREELHRSHRGMRHARTEAPAK